MPLLSDVELLRRLVCFDSTSSASNVPIAEAICDYLEAPGVRLERLPCDDPEKVNVIARLGSGGDEQEGLTLSGHMDVVPALEPDWSSDPFQLTERGGALFGRGSADMKGFIAVAMNRFAELAATGKALRRPLVLLLTCDEELGTLGAQDLVRRWSGIEPPPRATVIGEPTSLRAVRMHKGHLTMRVSICGRAAHSGSPHLGLNAIEPGGAVITALARLRADLAAEPAPNGEHFPQVPFTVLNVARVHGGEAVNVVPERCDIDLGIRLLPGQPGEPMVVRVREAVAGAAGDADVAVEVLNESPALELDETAPIYRSLCELLGQRETVGVSFASDAGPLQRVGQQCLLFGPGTIEVAHKADEHVPIEELRRCGEVLAALIERKVENRK